MESHTAQIEELESGKEAADEKIGKLEEGGEATATKLGELQTSDSEERRKIGFELCEWLRKSVAEE